jgi:hypothetical protein
MASIEEKGKHLSKAGYKTIAIAIYEGDARTAEDPVFKFVGLLPMIDPPREGICISNAVIMFFILRSSFVASPSCIAVLCSSNRHCPYDKLTPPCQYFSEDDHRRPCQCSL